MFASLIRRKQILKLALLVRLEDLVDSADADATRARVQKAFADYQQLLANGHYGHNEWKAGPTRFGRFPPDASAKALAEAQAEGRFGELKMWLELAQTGSGYEGD